MTEITHDAGAPESAIDTSRRTLIQRTVALGVLGGTLSYVPVANVKVMAAESNTTPFQQLSEFLVTQKLDGMLAKRYYAALAKRMPTLDADVAAVSKLVADNKLAHVDDFLALGNVDKPLMDSVQKIVSAWYIGIVGDDEKAELIAYSEALMYRPTKGILAVPTYGPGPNSWGEKPVDKTA